MNRSAFLKRLALGSAGLLVGDEVLEAFARLTHTRTMFPSAALVESEVVYNTTYSATTIAEICKVHRRLVEAMYFDAPEFAWLTSPPSRRQPPNVQYRRLTTRPFPLSRRLPA